MPEPIYRDAWQHQTHFKLHLFQLNTDRHGLKRLFRHLLVTTARSELGNMSNVIHWYHTKLNTMCTFPLPSCPGQD